MNKEGQKLVEIVNDPLNWVSQRQLKKAGISDKTRQRLENDPNKLSLVDYFKGELEYLGGYLLGFATKYKMGTRDLVRKSPKNIQYVCPFAFCQAMQIHPDELPETIQPENQVERPLIERTEINDTLQYRIHVSSLAYLSIPAVSEVSLDQLSDEELVRRHRVSGDDRFKKYFLEKYEETVKILIQRNKGFALPIEMLGLNTLVPAGNEGASDGFDMFDLTRDVKLTTYLPLRVQGNILDYLRSIDQVPRSLRNLAKKIKPLVEQAKEHGAHFDPKKYADAAGVSELSAQLAYELLRNGKGHFVSLDKAEYETDSFKEVRIKDLVKIELPLSKDPIRRFEMTDGISYLLQGLDPIEQEIIYGLYYDTRTMKEVGDSVGLSESRVSQMHTALLQKLKPIARRVFMK